MSSEDPPPDLLQSPWTTTLALALEDLWASRRASNQRLLLHSDDITPRRHMTLGWNQHEVTSLINPVGGEEGGWQGRGGEGGREERFQKLTSDLQV